MVAVTLPLCRCGSFVEAVAARSRAFRALLTHMPCSPASPSPISFVQLTQSAKKDSFKYRHSASKRSVLARMIPASLVTASEESFASFIRRTILPASRCVWLRRLSGSRRFSSQTRAGAVMRSGSYMTCNVLRDLPCDAIIGWIAAFTTPS